MIIRQVWEQKKPQQLKVTIPLNVGIVKGDYVKIEKIKKVS